MIGADAWLDLLLKRSAELRKAGILSVGCDGCSAVLAPAEPEHPADDDATTGDVAGEPVNPWEDPASYPSGHVPTLGDVEAPEKLPEIPLFGDG